MTSPKKIRFLYFLEYWPIPFGVLQTCCKIQKCKRNNFLLCLRNSCENTFSKLQIFIFYIYKKNVQNMLGYWSYAWKHFIYIYVYLPSLRWKPGILNARLIYFFIIKTKYNLKINMLENHQSLSLSFFGEKKGWNQ
jgi:hypothetical protein